MGQTEAGQGGGQQGERLEGSLTDGGSLPGNRPQDRSFGAGRQSDAREQSEPDQLAAGEQPGEAADSEAGEAGVSGEKSGYGNTPPR